MSGSGLPTSSPMSGRDAPQNIAAMLVGVLADGTNLGPKRMAGRRRGSAPTRSAGCAASTSAPKRTGPRRHASPMPIPRHLHSQIWSDGTTASSDGQFFRATYQPGDYRLAGFLFKVSERIGVRRKSKFDSLMRRAIFAKNDFQIDIRSELRVQTRIKARSRFASCLANLIGFKRTLNDLSNRPIFTTSKPMGQVPGFGASNRELWCGHRDLLCMRI